MPPVARGRLRWPPRRVPRRCRWRRTAVPPLALGLRLRAMIRRRPAGGRQDGGEADRAVADHGDNVARGTPALTAAWWPVHMTSESVSSDRSISSSGRNREPRRVCCRRVEHAPPLLGRRRSRRCRKSRRRRRRWSTRSAVRAGAVAVDERGDHELTLGDSCTSAPRSSTTPMNSWPIGPTEWGDSPR